MFDRQTLQFARDAHNKKDALHVKNAEMSLYVRAVQTLSTH